MKFNITLNEQDYINFNSIHMLNSKAYMKMQKIVKAVILATLTVIIFLVFYLNKGVSIIVPLTETVIISALTFAYLKFILPKIHNKAVKQTVKMIKKDGKLPYDEKSEIEFTNREIIEKTSNSETYLNYADVEKLIITDSYLIIYTDSSRAIIVPTKQLGNDKGNVIKLLKEKLGKSKTIE